jgi:serpin B
MKGKRFAALALLVGLVGLLGALATGCARVSQPVVAQAAVARVASPQLPENDLSALVAGNSAFAGDLYGALSGDGGNIFYSPYSISAALAMAYGGARGVTETQMASTLHYTLPQERLHQAFNALDQQLAGRGAGAKGQDGKPFRLKVSNSLWGQTGYRFLPGYLDLLAANYGAGLRLTDFKNAREPSRVAINGWVKEQTEEKIPELLAPGVVDETTRLILVNAVYFNGGWKYPFAKESTRPLPFNLLEGRQADVPMMRQTRSLAYTRGQGYQAVELPYDGSELSMVVLLPDQGNFQQFQTSLTAESIQQALQGLQPRQVALTMPKFRYESSFSLAKTLSTMGMPDAMMPGVADFSGISEKGEDSLFIQDVIHKAIVAVDENGTEAAAATGVVMSTTAAPMPVPEVVTLTVDRPFVFLIRDLKTGTLLFVGRVLNPAA